MKEQAEIARDYIINGIITHRIFPGSVLFETVVAEKLSMSRTPVRQALNDIVSMGILEHIKGKRGYALPDLSCNDMHHVYNTRKSIEMQAVEEAASLGVSFEDRRIRNLLLLNKREREAKAERDRFVFGLINKDIHFGLIGLSGNIYLARIFPPIFWRASLYDFHFSTFYNDAASAEEPGYGTPDEHRAIVEAICCGDGDEAKRCIERHIVPGIERYQQIYDNLKNIT